MSLAPQLYTVAAGACMEGGSQYWCALEASQCNSDTQTFVSARQLELYHQDQPSFSCLSQGLKVPVGKCTQPTDQGLCTGHKSNCEGCYETSGVCFEEQSQECTLEPHMLERNDDQSVDFATFGQCYNPDTNQNYCLWSSDECSSEHTWITPATSSMMKNDDGMMTIGDLCTCDKVLLGACVKDDQFQCAVSSLSCDEDSTYWTAHDLREEYPQIDCRLCESFDMDASTPIQMRQEAPSYTASSVTVTSADPESTSYMAPSGACVRDGKFTCVLEKSQCANAEDFVSAQQLEKDHQNTPELSCLGQTNQVPVGKCTLPTDEGMCTGHMSNCQGCYETSNVCFEGNSDDCTLQPTQDSSQENIVNFGVFGLCVNNDKQEEHCLWSRSECASEHEWLTPSVYIKDQARTVADLCTCDKVVIGACVDDDNENFVCAVSADSCDTDSQYLGAKALRDEHPHVDCRLCQDFELPKNVLLQLSDSFSNHSAGSKPAQSDDTSNNRKPQITKPTKYIAPSGACVKGTQYVCALEKTQCAGGWDYVSAYQLMSDDAHKNEPHASCLGEANNHVPVGQCTMPEDEGICTSHPSGCQGCYDSSKICFQQDSEDCLLEPQQLVANNNNNNNEVNFAVFGQCINQDTQQTHCLWSSNECSDQHEWLPPSLYLTGDDMVDDVCTCEKVVIGACHQGDEFQCAVSPDGCDDNSEYIMAKELRDINPNLDCRLCAEFDLPQNTELKLTHITTTPHASNNVVSPPATATVTSSASHNNNNNNKVTTYVAPSGACVNSMTQQYWCAFERTQCPEGSNFVSARQLESNWYQSSPVASCLGAAASVPVGKCTSTEDKGVCTGHQSNCQGCYDSSEICFEGNHEECTLEPTVDANGFVNFAIFGLCIDQILGEQHCVWSSNECNAAHEWVTPARNLENNPKDLANYCTCDKVVIGACRFGNSNQFTCAVSEDACDSQSTYIGGKELRDLDPTIDCRLCQAFEELPDLSKYNPKPAAGTPFNEFSNLKKKPTRAPNNPNYKPNDPIYKPQGQSGDKTIPDAHTKPMENKEEDNKDQKGTIALVILTLVLFFGGFCLAIHKVERKRRLRTAETEGLTIDANGSAIMKAVPPPNAFKEKFHFSSFLPAINTSISSMSRKKKSDDMNERNIAPHREEGDADTPDIYPVQKKKFSMTSISSMIKKTSDEKESSNEEENDDDILFDGISSYAPQMGYEPMT